MPEGDSTSKARPRLWPGLGVAAAVVVMRYLSPLVFPGAAEVGQIAGLAGAALIAVWWLLFSRAGWLARVAAVVTMPLAAFATRPFLDPSIAGGAMGLLPFIVAMPPIALALVAWAWLTRGASAQRQWILMPVALLAGSATTTALRTDGIGGGTLFQLQWRWTPTAEERLLARQDADPEPSPEASPRELPGAPSVPPDTSAPSVATADPVPATPSASPHDVTTPALTSAETTNAPEWPGFRGRERDGVVHGVRIDTDWISSPPVALWRRPIGPGWSSFAVSADLLYTQEQRGDDEVVACYRVSTGEPVWRHRDPVRFYESNGGAGPRGTPTLSGGRVYALGATGMLNALDARTGAVVWSRAATRDATTEVPTWGVSSSPLVVGDLVIVATGGTLSAYDARTGTPRWAGPKHEFSYSSPHLVTIGGTTQVLLLSPPGVVAVSPADGRLLWEHQWKGGAIVQPAVTEDGVLVSGLTGTGGLGLRRLTIQLGAEGWAVRERWTSTGLKPYFNDYLVHNGYAYGFDGSILASIDLSSGARKWKGGRYGNGQALLLADQDLLLVVAEDGGLALVSATPEAFTEIARAPAIDGKTWNHPVLVGNVLLVRNGEEMAAFRLALATR